MLRLRMGGLGCVGRADTASLPPGAHARPLLPPGGAARPLPQPGGGRAASPARALRCREAASSSIPLLAPGGRRASQKSPPQEIHPAFTLSCLSGSHRFLNSVIILCQPQSLSRAQPPPNWRYLPPLLTGRRATTGFGLLGSRTLSPRSLRTWV